MSYRIEKYAADGCEGGPEDDYIIRRHVPTIAEARAIVREILGLRRLAPSRRWSGVGDTVEAYHDFPPSHPRADGCGGVLIAREHEVATTAKAARAARKGTK